MQYCWNWLEWKWEEWTFKSIILAISLPNQFIMLQLCLHSNRYGQYTGSLKIHSPRQARPQSVQVWLRLSLNQDDLWTRSWSGCPDVVWNYWFDSCGWSREIRVLLDGLVLLPPVAHFWILSLPLLSALLPPSGAPCHLHQHLLPSVYGPYHGEHMDSQPILLWNIWLLDQFVMGHPASMCDTWNEYNENCDSW